MQSSEVSEVSEEPAPSKSLSAARLTDGNFESTPLRQATGFFFIAFGDKRQPSQISQLNTNTRKWPLPLLAERVSTTTGRSFTVAPPTAETIASQRVWSSSKKKRSNNLASQFAVQPRAFFKLYSPRNPQRAPVAPEKRPLHSIRSDLFIRNGCLLGCAG